MSIFEERIYSTLVGVMYGDAYGMPTEGMSLEQIKKVCPDGIRRFISSVNYDISTRRYDAGSITDDTMHTLLLIDSIDAADGKINGNLYMEYLKKWYHENPKADEVIGPSTLNAIRAFEKGEKNAAADYAVTNGCMMKIAPIGLILDKKEDILEAVTEICRYTHNANVALSSAAMIAYLIAVFSRNKGDLDKIDELLGEMAEYARGTGFDMPSASVLKRVELGNQILKKGLAVEDFMREVYDLIGTGIYCTETLPAVVTILKYCHGNMAQTAQICAGIGGDTDTIASIACAVCGSLGSLPSENEIALLEGRNGLSIQEYAQKIMSCVQTR